MSLLTSSVSDPFRALKRAMDAQEPRVVVVVGAGVSIGATGAAHASWKGLLEHGLGFLRDRGDFGPARCDVFMRRLSEAFSPFDPELALELAENIQHSMQHPDPDAFAVWLESAFDAFAAQPGRRATLDALLELQRAGALLLTTNYDSLLSDCTGLRPVTRDDKEAFLRVVNRQDEGILHIHGHWREPASVVLGVRSYDDIVDDPLFQDGFKSLWMQNHWLYVGCGNGLEDPNLGRLLEWGKQWGKGPREHYYLSIEKEADALRDHPGTPANLICVGMADFASVPPVLHDLSPVVRCGPFARIEADCAHVRPAYSSHTDNPFPSWQEYLNGDVPALQVDDLVRERLRTHGWAFVLDVASVGKTTLAMRMATTADQRDRPAFHLDLADVGPDEDDDSWAMALMALRRLAKPGTLLIVDNAHHAPALARKLWTQWRESRSSGRLLLIATEVERAVTIDPAQDLGFFRMHPDNPALALRPQPEDLKRILHSILRRFGSHRTSASMQDPPSEAVDQWYRDYGHALGAFCIAVLGCRGRLQSGDWSLPYAAASEWVWEKWLRPLDDANRANALCLAAFGAQELEITVAPAALPQPSKLGQLLRLGLVAKSVHGKQQQFPRYRLREPSWGRLLLASHHARESGGQDVEGLNELLLIEAATRDLGTASLLSFRWRSLGIADSASRMWARLAEWPRYVTTERLPVNCLPLLAFIKEAEISQQRSLADQVWSALEHASQDVLKRLVHETSFSRISHFLKIAHTEGRIAVSDKIWGVLEATPDNLAAAAFATSLENVAHFLETAHRQDRTVVFEQLWGTLEASPDRLAEAAFATRFGKTAHFLRAARQYGKTTVCDRLWDSLEDDPERLASAALATPLGEVAHFLEIAKQHQRDAVYDQFWSALEENHRQLADTAFATSLEHVARFLEIAKQQQRSTICDQLWTSLEAGQRQLTETALTTSLEHLAHFLEIAKQHQRTAICDHLWNALEEDRKRLADAAFATSLGHVAHFLKIAKLHQRTSVYNSLWEDLEADRKRLTETAFKTPLEHLAHFLGFARQQGRATVCDQLWGELEASPKRLENAAFSTSLEHVARFLEIALQQVGTVVCNSLWGALEADPTRLAGAAFATSLHGLSNFLEAARKHERLLLLERLWFEIENHVDIVSKKVEESETQIAGYFLEIIKRHGRDPLTESGRDSSLGVESVVETQALTYRILEGISVGHWAARGQQSPMNRAASIAMHCHRVGQHQHGQAILSVLLDRSEAIDFSPQQSGFSEAAFTLRYLVEQSDPRQSKLLEVLCTKRWLGWQYSKAKTSVLASGLRLLAMYQPTHVVRRFRNVGLQLRINKEFSVFSKLDSEHQHLCVQLLGCSVLFGQSADIYLLRDATDEIFSMLPERILPHREGETHVEEWQYQLWLGLRTVVALNKRPLTLAPDLIRQTRDLWRFNLERSATAPLGAEHRVDQQMVAWLDDCLRRGECDLIPPNRFFLLPELAGPKPG